MEYSSQSNLNPDEIAKFDNMAQDWWDPEGPCAPLHQLNPIRTQWILSQCSHLSHKAVLDVGCGGGLLTEALAPHCLQITGIDGSAKAIKVATQHAQAYQKVIDYYCITAENFAEQRSHQFDVVSCLELIEHVPDPQQLINALSKLVNKEGLVFISTLNRTFKAYLSAIIGAEYVLEMLPKGTHDYQQFIKPSELITMARRAGLSLVALQGVHYQLVKQRFILSDKLNVNYLACFKQES